MTESFNPYQAPETIPEEARDDRSLRFEGVITKEDYSRMFPGRNEGWVWALLIAVLVILMLLICATLFIFFRELQGIGSLVVLVLLLGFGGVIGYALRRVFPERRIAQTLLQNPDLLGNVRGELSSEGLLISDDVKSVWLGPAILATSWFSPGGIRIPLENTAHRYYALSARLFDVFDRPVLLRFRKAWQSDLLKRGRLLNSLVEAGVTLDRARPPQETENKQFAVISKRPDRATSFQIVRAFGIFNLLQTLAMQLGPMLLGASFFAWRLFVEARKESLTTYAYLIILGGAIVHFLWTWYRASTSDGMCRLHGWVSDQEVSVFTGDRGTRLPLSQLQVEWLSETALCVSWRHKRLAVLNESDFANKEDWNRAVELLSRSQPESTNASVE